MDHNAGPLADTEVHHLASSHVGDEFKIFVGHCGTQLREPLPVLYLTDANGCFGVAVDTIRSMQLVRLIPPLLVVGIGYPRGILAETASIRVRDLTPTRDEIYDRLYPDNCGMSGADRFLAFIRSELMPWVAQRFPVEFGDSIYFGHSLGGLFGTVVMLSEPDTFARYILGARRTGGTETRSSTSRPGTRRITPTSAPTYSSASVPTRTTRGGCAS